MWNEWDEVRVVMVLVGGWLENLWARCVSQTKGNSKLNVIVANFIWPWQWIITLLDPLDSLQATADRKFNLEFVLGFTRYTVRRTRKFPPLPISFRIPGSPGVFVVPRNGSKLNQLIEVQVIRLPFWDL